MATYIIFAREEDGEHDRVDEVGAVVDAGHGDPHGRGKDGVGHASNALDGGKHDPPKHYAPYEPAEPYVHGVANMRQSGRDETLVENIKIEVLLFRKTADVVLASQCKLINIPEKKTQSPSRLGEMSVFSIIW